MNGKAGIIILSRNPTDPEVWLLTVYKYETFSSSSNMPFCLYYCVLRYNVSSLLIILYDHICIEYSPIISVLAAFYRIPGNSTLL